MRGKDWFPSNRKVGSHRLGLAWALGTWSLRGLSSFAAGNVNL
jgi:hypothetical protein